MYYGPTHAEVTRGDVPAYLTRITEEKSLLNLARVCFRLTIAMVEETVADPGGRAHSLLGSNR